MLHGPGKVFFLGHVETCEIPPPGVALDVVEQTWVWHVHLFEDLLPVSGEGLLLTGIVGVGDGLVLALHGTQINSLTKG